MCFYILCHVILHVKLVQDLIKINVHHVLREIKITENVNVNQVIIIIHYKILDVNKSVIEVMKYQILIKFAFQIKKYKNI